MTACLKPEHYETRDLNYCSQQQQLPDVVLLGITKNNRGRFQVVISMVIYLMGIVYIILQYAEFIDLGCDVLIPQPSCHLLLMNKDLARGFILITQALGQQNY